MNKTRQWTMLTALGVVAILAVGWFVIVSPQHKHAATLRTQASGIESSNASLQSQVRQLQRQQAGVPAAQKQLAAIATKIPDNPALPALIRQLSAAAKGAGVDLVSLAPGQPGAAAGTPTSIGAQSSLLQIPVTISITGSYFNNESFFNSIENLSRAMLVSSFTMAPGGGSTASGTVPNSITAQISAVIFESPSVAPVAPATTTTGATTATAPSPAASAPASSTTTSSASTSAPK